MKKRAIKILFLSALVIAFSIGIFLVGKKFGEKKEASQVKNNQKIEWEKQLQQLKSQLQKETNPSKRQQLEQRVKSLEQQMQSLGNPNNPSPQKSPQKTSRQLAVKYNTEVGGKHEYIDTNDYKKRVLIDTKNKIFSSNSDLTIKNSQYNFSFNEEDATEKKGNNFIFDENNTNFQLTPTTPSPGNPGPNNNSKDKIELEVKWDGFLKNDYWLFVNSDWPATKKRFHVAKNHPVFKGKKIDKPPLPLFQLSFLKKDASKGDDNMDDGEYFFDENNQKFTLNPLGNWPDDPNYQKTPKPKTVKELKYASFTNDYITFSNNMSGTIYRYELESYHVHKDNPEAKRIDSILNIKEEHKKDRIDRKTLIFSYGDLNNLKQDQDGSCDYYFEAYNDTLEIKEKS